MIELSAIRKRARTSLEGRLFGNVWMTLLLCDVIAGAIVGLPNLFSRVLAVISPRLAAGFSVPILLASLVISGPMTYGTTRLYHKTAKDGTRPALSELFCGFREELGESFLLGLTRSLFIFLWTLLLIIPGIVKGYAYSMAFYIQQEAKEKNWRLCLDKSNELTKGYKGKLFLLDLSFIGWYLVGLLCLGVGVLWVAVYHGEARAHFYEELKKIKSESGFSIDDEDIVGSSLSGTSSDSSSESDGYDPFGDLPPVGGDESGRDDPFAELGRGDDSAQ